MRWKKALEEGFRDWRLQDRGQWRTLLVAVAAGVLINGAVIAGEPAGELRRAHPVSVRWRQRTALVAGAGGLLRTRLCD